MKKVLVYIIVFALFYGITACVAKAKTQEQLVQSTQGVEVNTETSKKITKSKNNKNPAKTKRKNRNKYIKTLKKVEKANNKKRIRNRNLDFLNEQLEIKKNKLEKLNSNVKKGENEK